MSVNSRIAIAIAEWSARSTVLAIMTPSTDRAINVVIPLGPLSWRSICMLLHERCAWRDRNSCPGPPWLRWSLASWVVPLTWAEPAICARDPQRSRTVAFDTKVNNITTIYPGHSGSRPLRSVVQVPGLIKLVLCQPDDHSVTELWMYGSLRRINWIIHERILPPVGPIIS